MEKPLPLIVEKDQKLSLNEEVMNIIKNSIKPRFILFYGKTRVGKSTTLNQLIRGNIETCKYINKKPFDSCGTVNSVTKGCDIFGPIKISELMKRHGRKKKMKDNEDYDVFFCDTEGISSLDGIQKTTIPGILTLLQICTISVFMVKENCNADDVKEISSQIQLSRMLPKDLSSRPKVTVYIADILADKKGDDEEEDDDDIESWKEKYADSVKIESRRIFDEVKRKYPNLDIEVTDFEVIAGGPYDKNMKKEPDREDTKVKLYWESIKNILSVFIKNNEKEKEYKDKINLIKCLFEIFTEIDTISEDFNLEDFLQAYLTKKFEKYTKEQFDLKLKKIKEEIKTNFLDYMNILKDDNKAKEKINECIEKDYSEIFNNAIKEKVINFIKLSIEQYRKAIKEQIDKEFESICENILSDENVNSLIKDIISMINKSEFKEDINMDLINNPDKFWNDMYEKNKVILNYFKKSKAGILDNLKENFLSKISTIFRELLSQKKLWSNYLKESLLSIQKKINREYLEMLGKCNYQEDIELHIKNNEKFYEETFPNIKEKYFKNISETRLNEVKEKIKIIFKEEYDKILKNKLPVWKTIKADISKRIKENLESYLSKIFNDKEFRDEIDPNLGRKDNLLRIIPADISQNSQIKKEKKDEVHNLIENEVENTVKIFNEKREKLSLFEESVGNKIKICSKIIDDKMKEIINKFYYLEDKIIFNSDTIFSLLTSNQEIYKNFGSKVKELNLKLRELCDEKSKEYDLLVQRNKPEWNKIKSEKISKINDICQNYIKNIIGNAFFQDDVGKIDGDALKKSIIESPDFYKGIETTKKSEINSEIEKNIEKTVDKINSKKNSLQNWGTIKTQLLQQAYIEMNNKSRTNLGSTNLDQVTNILSGHIETLPKFFDVCKTEERKNELRSEIKNNARQIAQDYINKKLEEEKRKREEEERERRYQRMLEEAEERRRQAEREAEMERRRRQEEERRRRQEEENRRRRQEEENRRRQEEERRRREHEENERRRREDDHRRHIEDLARRVIRGEFGSGQTRMNRLGGEFKEVQNKVNEMLGCKFRYK